MIVKRLIKKGRLNLVLPDGTTTTYLGKEKGISANFFLKDWQVFERILTHADIGFGEDYIKGNWETDDLLRFMRFAVENQNALQNSINGNFFYRTFFALRQKLRTNSLEGSKKNIHDHYDLGNSFFRLWLDEGMTYSGALFQENPATSLKEAQRAKYQRILNRLSPSSNDHILEIGCGWGGFIEIAAETGCKVTGVTISKEQADYTTERLKKSEYGQNIDIHLQDYRTLEGQYDHIVSIGMFEHVGSAFWRDYMQTLARCLKPDGKIMLQSIIIREDLFDAYYHSSDFIREYIFPGGMLPSLSKFEEEANAAHLLVKEKFCFGRDYAITLEKWLENFDAKHKQIRALGFDEAFIRKWRFYLALCSALFSVGRINVMQAELYKNNSLNNIALPHTECICLQ